MRSRLPLRTQALSSVLQSPSDARLLLQQLQEGRGWQLLLAACEVKGTRHAPMRACQPGAAAGPEAGDRAAGACGCALAALSAALQLALASGSALTSSSREQQQHMQVQVQEQERGWEPEGCRAMAHQLPPPFVLPRLVSMINTNLAAANGTGSSSGSSCSSSDMGVVVGKYKAPLRTGCVKPKSVQSCILARHVMVFGATNPRA